MITSLSWLKNHLSTKANIKQVVERLTQIGLEVESVKAPDSDLDNFIICKVVKSQKHPNADKLKICDVDIGKTNLVKVVCGAPNASDGLFTVYAPPGAIIPKTKMKIKVAKIRGIESSGMLCSGSELNKSSDKDGIIELNKNQKNIGEKYFKSSAEEVIDISVTPNRPDCLGIRGIARDLAASGLGQLKNQPPIKINQKFKQPIKVSISKEKNQGCGIFGSIYIKNVQNIETEKGTDQKEVDKTAPKYTPPSSRPPKKDTSVSGSITQGAKAGGTEKAKKKKFSSLTNSFNPRNMYKFETDLNENIIGASFAKGDNQGNFNNEVDAVKDALAQIQELSPQTMSSYQKKAGKQYRQAKGEKPMNPEYTAGLNAAGKMSDKDMDDNDKTYDTMKKRGKGLAMSKGKGKMDELNIPNVGKYTKKPEPHFTNIRGGVKKQLDKRFGPEKTPAPRITLKNAFSEGAFKEMDTKKQENERLAKKKKGSEYSDKEVRMGSGVAFDKRYKGGNMTGAYKTINKIKKGLGDHPKVADALRRANEQFNNEGE